MVLRNIFALDSDNLVVTSSSDAGLIGNGIINNSDTPDGTVFVYSSGSGATIQIDDLNTFADNIPDDNNLFFNDDDETNHIVTDGRGLVANGQQVEAESTILLRALDENGNQTGPTIELTVFSQNGVTQDVWGFAADQTLQNGVSYVKVGGDNDGTIRYTEFAVCFGPGTELLTDKGPVPIDKIAVGTLVWTRDAGYQPVTWVGRTKVAAEGVFAPVVIAAGALGNDRTLVLSQEHRIALHHPLAELWFGESDVLVAAKHLCGLEGIALRPGGTVTYTHFMCDQHQIVCANGIEAESFYLSDASVSVLEAGQQRELLALFPSLSQGQAAFGPIAAPTLKAFEAVLLGSHLHG